MKEKSPEDASALRSPRLLCCVNGRDAAAEGDGLAGGEAVGGEELHHTSDYPCDFGLQPEVGKPRISLSCWPIELAPTPA